MMGAKRKKRMSAIGVWITREATTDESGRWSAKAHVMWARWGPFAGVFDPVAGLRPNWHVGELRHGE
eukprot:3852929-Pyramimonas_sp.AAC.1